MVLQDRYGNALSTQSAAAAERYSEGIDRALGALGGPLESLEAAGAADPGFALPQVARARLLQFQGQAAAAREGAARARALVQGASRREQQHVEVIATAIEGDAARALRLVREHAAEFPRDAFVLEQANGVYGLIGFSGRQDRNAELLAILEGVADAYGDDWWFLSALSFAQVEAGQVEAARRNGERSLALRRGNGFVSHALAHVFFETGEAAAGAAFLEGWLPDYQRSAQLYTHLFWHLALFTLAGGDCERTLAIYDAEIRPGISQSAPLGLIADSASLLWRCTLQGCGGELPWGPVGEFAGQAFTRPGIMFADVHCALAYAAAGETEALGRLIDELRERVRQGKIPAGEVVPLLAEGVGAFAEGDYESVIQILAPIQGAVVRIGGSHAQRELFEDTLLQAYLRTGRREPAEALLRERLERRPSARDRQWLEGAAESRVGNGDGA